MFTFNQPDYGTLVDLWVTGGADYRFGNWSFGQPAIAARLSFVPWGSNIGEYTYLFGPEYHMRGRRFRPYADFHLGISNITYEKGHTEENYIPPSAVSNDSRPDQQSHGICL